MSSTLEVGIVRKNLRLAHAAGEHAEHVAYADAHAANARVAVALLGLDRDAGEERVHVGRLAFPRLARMEGVAPALIRPSSLCESRGHLLPEGEGRNYAR